MGEVVDLASRERLRGRETPKAREWQAIVLLFEGVRIERAQPDCLEGAERSDSPDGTARGGREH